jgi:hypothetical protein
MPDRAAAECQPYADLTPPQADEVAQRAVYAKARKQQGSAGECRQERRWCSQQGTDGVPDISAHGVHAARDVDVARPFTLDEGAAELQSRTACGLRRVETLLAEVVRALGKMEGQLAIDLLLHAPRSKRVE